MSNEIALPSDYREKVVSHVKNTMFALLPDDQFKALVENEMKAFFEGEGVEFVVSVERARSWADLEALKKAACVTPFRKMVWDTMKPLVDAKFAEMLKADAFAKVATYVEQADQWATKKLTLAKEVDELIERVAIVAAIEQQKAMFQEAVRTSVSHVEQQMVLQLGRITATARLDTTQDSGIAIDINHNGEFVDQFGNPIYRRGG